MAFEGNERADRHVKLTQPLGAAEVRQVDDEAGGEDLRPELPQQFHGALGSPARGDEIIDQYYAVAAFDGILVHLDLVEAVLQRVGDRNPLVRKFAFFPDGHETCRNLMRNGASKYKAAGFDAGDLVDLGTGPGLDQLINRAPKCPC